MIVFGDIDCCWCCCYCCCLSTPLILDIDQHEPSNDDYFWITTLSKCMVIPLVLPWAVAWRPGDELDIHAIGASSNWSMVPFMMVK